MVRGNVVGYYKADGGVSALTLQGYDIRVV